MKKGLCPLVTVILQISINTNNSAKSLNLNNRKETLATDDSTSRKSSNSSIEKGTVAAGDSASMKSSNSSSRKRTLITANTPSPTKRLCKGDLNTHKSQEGHEPSDTNTPEASERCQAPCTEENSETEDKKNAFMCHECSIEFSGPKALARHRIMHTRNAKYKCSHCTASFHSPVHVFDHEGLHTRGLYKCEVCSKPFVWGDTMRKHMKKVHQRTSGKMDDSPSAARTSHDSNGQDGAPRGKESQTSMTSESQKDNNFTGARTLRSRKGDSNCNEGVPGKEECQSRSTMESKGSLRSSMQENSGKRGTAPLGTRTLRHRDCKANHEDGAPVKEESHSSKRKTKNLQSSPGKDNISKSARTLRHSKCDLKCENDATGKKGMTKESKNLSASSMQEKDGCQYESEDSKKKDNIPAPARTLRRREHSANPGDDGAPVKEESQSSSKVMTMEFKESFVTSMQEKNGAPGKEELPSSSKDMTMEFKGSFTSSAEEKDCAPGKSESPSSSKDMKMESKDFLMQEKSGIKCEHCPKMFQTLKDQKMHHLIHTAYYECWMCPQKFLPSETFYRHLRQHFKCEFCTETFRDEEGLKEHQQAHKEQFKCEFCSETFLEETSLKEHMQVHREPQFKCELCSATFQEETGVESACKGT